MEDEHPTEYRYHNDFCPFFIYVYVKNVKIITLSLHIDDDLYSNENMNFIEIRVMTLFSNKREIESLCECGLCT